MGKGFAVLRANNTVSSEFPGAAPLATPDSLAASLGMSSAAISQRWLLVQQTQALLSPPLDPGYKFAQGVPDFQFPTFNSWVRFAFSSMNNSSKQLWAAGRVFRGRCGTKAEILSFHSQIQFHSYIRHCQHANGRPPHPASSFKTRNCVSVLR